MSNPLLLALMPADAIQAQLDRVGAQSPVAGVDCHAVASAMCVAEAIQVLIESVPALPNLDTVQIGSPGRLAAIIRRYAAIAVLQAFLSAPRVEDQ